MSKLYNIYTVSDVLSTQNVGNKTVNKVNQWMTMHPAEIQSNLSYTAKVSQSHSKITFEGRWLFDTGPLTVEMNNWGHRILILKAGDCLMEVTT